MKVVRQIVPQLFKRLLHEDMVTVGNVDTDKASSVAAKRLCSLDKISGHADSSTHPDTCFYHLTLFKDGVVAMNDSDAASDLMVLAISDSVTVSIGLEMIGSVSFNSPQPTRDINLRSRSYV